VGEPPVPSRPTAATIRFCQGPITWDGWAVGWEVHHLKGESPSSSKRATWMEPARTPPAGDAAGGPSTPPEGPPLRSPSHVAKGSISVASRSSPSATPKARAEVLAGSSDQDHAESGNELPDGQRKGPGQEPGKKRSLKKKSRPAPELPSLPVADLLKQKGRRRPGGAGEQRRRDVHATEVCPRGWPERGFATNSCEVGGCGVGGRQVQKGGCRDNRLDAAGFG